MICKGLCEPEKKIKWITDNNQIDFTSQIARKLRPLGEQGLQRICAACELELQRICDAALAHMRCIWAGAPAHMHWRCARSAIFQEIEGHPPVEVFAIVAYQCIVDVPAHWVFSRHRYLFCVVSRGAGHTRCICAAYELELQLICARAAAHMRCIWAGAPAHMHWSVPKAWFFKRYRVTHPRKWFLLLHIKVLSKFRLIKYSYGSDNQFLYFFGFISCTVLKIRFENRSRGVPEHVRFLFQKFYHIRIRSICTQFNF